MESSRAAMTYATALNRNELYESYGLRARIPRLLHPDEEVLLVLPGVAGDFPDVMIATATRFLLAAVAGPIKDAKIKREIPASEVASVRYRRGFLTRVRVASTTGREIKMIPAHNHDAERFVAEFDHLLSTGRLPS